MFEMTPIAHFRSRLFFSLALAFSAGLPVAAQQNDSPASDSRSSLSQVLATTGQVSDVEGLADQDYLNIKLPPLQELIENAKKSPTVEYFDARKQEEEHELKSIRRNWLSYVKINSSYQYGVTSYYSLYEADPSVPQIGAANDARGLWNVGASLSIPVLELFDRRNKIKKQQIRVDEADFEAARWHDEQTLKIINAYTTALQYLDRIKPVADAMTVANAQYKVTESDFINGKTDAQALSRQKNIQVQAVKDYLETRAILNNALLSLEVLSKTKIIKK